MNKLLLALIITCPILVHAQTAKILIDTARVVSAIDPNIY